jgi:hypothetical protein
MCRILAPCFLKQMETRAVSNDIYILANPERAGLAASEPDWPFSGMVVPGYPDLYPFQEDFWELFWKIYYQHREPGRSSRRCRNENLALLSRARPRNYSSTGMTRLSMM